MIHEIWGQLTPSLLINIWTLHKVPCTIFLFSVRWLNYYIFRKYLHVRIILFQVASSSNEYRDWWKLKWYAASIISHDQASIWLLWQMSSRELSWAGSWAELEQVLELRRVGQIVAGGEQLSRRQLLPSYHGDVRNIASCSSNLMVSGCYWKISTFRTVMAAPDTRYSARQFNFNQRMVLILMILLYNFRLFNTTPHVQFSRNVVGGKE